MPTVLAYTFGAEWSQIATRAEEALASGRLARQPVGPMVAGFAALAAAAAGDTERARRRARSLASLLRQIDPQALMYGLTLDLLVLTIDRLGTAELARELLPLARDAEEFARGGLPLCTTSLTHARLLVLIGDHTAADVAYERAATEAQERGLVPCSSSHCSSVRSRRVRRSIRQPGRRS